ncbi:MAG: OmpL47-type beta-barrel domain-containing protein, partial [Gaiellaceae bacterium]
MDNQEDIVNFQSMFNGPWPLTTDGIIVGTPSASFEEEMQGKITFAGGSIGPSLTTFNHENMHQWFGDNVSEAAFNLTFWKEGWATIGEYLSTARTAAIAAGGLGTPAGDAAFDTSLNNRFNTNYGTTSSSFWTTAPSNPTVGSLFTTSNTYTRPGTAYLALRKVLGQDRWITVMKNIQSTYGGGNITEPQLEQAFRDQLPTPSGSCNARLDQFFPQWFDTAFPTGGTNTTNKPKITGPALNGTGFVCAQVAPASPNGSNGWYTSAPTLTWQGFGASPFTKTGCVDGAVTTEGISTLSCDVTTTTAPIFSAGPVSETVKLDSVAPVTTASVSPPAPDLANGWYGSGPTVTLSASDGTSGVASTKYTIDGGTPQTYSAPFAVSTEGSHTVSYWSTDNAGNVETAHTLTIKVDLNPPTTTATLAPAIHNGWYASPTLTLTGDDGAGSGVAHIDYSLDGGAFQTYSGPISGFSTGNHFVQYRATDVAGRVEATKLIAFKVDAEPPTVTITRPKEGASFKQHKIVKANYKCADKGKGSGLDTCVGDVPSGSPIDTSTAGSHTFTVTATDKAGNTTTVTHHYTVVATARPLSAMARWKT